MEERLCNSFKVVAVTDCPEHPDRTICDCEAALELLTLEATHYVKSKFFLLAWDAYLLTNESCEHAFRYSGDQESHHIFASNVGDTLKHFARAWLQEAGFLELFVPAGRLQDTVQALVNYWVVRNAQWQHVYGTLAHATQKWVAEKYDTLDRVEVEDSDLLRGNHHLKAGDRIETVKCEYGPPDHRCTAYVTPTMNAVGGVAIQISRRDECHENCAVMKTEHDEALKQICRRLARDGGDAGSESSNSKTKLFSSMDELLTYARM